MAKGALFTLKLEPTLRAAFMEEARSAHRPASQILRDLMRDYIDRQRAGRDHDAWFRTEVTEGLSEAVDPSIRRVPQAEMSESWRQRRATWAQRAGDKAE
jgi:predicted transcriptional regulator